MSKNLKNDIRQQILTLLRNQKEEDRVKKSQEIQEKLFNLPEFQKAKTILFYAAFDGEVDTSVMMRQAINLDKTIALPISIDKDKTIIPKQIKNLDTDLEEGLYGIQQPKENSETISASDLDLVVVPGVAFDKGNNRLGRGQGYYDRFLSQLSPDTPAIGLAFDFQMVDSLPHKKEHDVPVLKVVSN